MSRPHFLKHSLLSLAILSTFPSHAFPSDNWLTERAGYYHIVSLENQSSVQNVWATWDNSIPEAKFVFLADAVNDISFPLVELKNLSLTVNDVHSNNLLSISTLELFGNYTNQVRSTDLSLTIQNSTFNNTSINTVFLGTIKEANLGNTSLIMNSSLADGAMAVFSQNNQNLTTDGTFLNVEKSEVKGSLSGIYNHNSAFVLSDYGENAQPDEPTQLMLDLRDTDLEISESIANSVKGIDINLSLTEKSELAGEALGVSLNGQIDTVNVNINDQSKVSYVSGVSSSIYSSEKGNGQRELSAYSDLSISNVTVQSSEHSQIKESLTGIYSRASADGQAYLLGDVFNTRVCVQSSQVGQNLYGINLSLESDGYLTAGAQLKANIDKTSVVVSDQSHIGGEFLAVTSELEQTLTNDLSGVFEGATIDQMVSNTSVLVIDHSQVDKNLIAVRTSLLFNIDSLPNVSLNAYSDLKGEVHRTQLVIENHSTVGLGAEMTAQTVGVDFSIENTDKLIEQWSNMSTDVDVNVADTQVVVSDHSTVQGLVQVVNFDLNTLGRTHADTTIDHSEVFVKNHSEIKGSIEAVHLGLVTDEADGHFSVDHSSVAVTDSSRVSGDVYGVLINFDANDTRMTTSVDHTKILVDHSIIHGDLTGVFVDASGQGLKGSVDRTSIYLNDADIYGRVSGLLVDGEAQSAFSIGSSTLYVSGRNRVQSISGFNQLYMTVSDQNRSQTLLTFMSDHVLEEGRPLSLEHRQLSSLDTIVFDFSNVAYGSDYLLLGAQEGGITLDAGISLKTMTTFTESTVVLDSALSIANGETLTTGLLQQNGIDLMVNVKVNQNAQTLADNTVATMAFVHQGWERIQEAVPVQKDLSQDNIHSFASLNGSWVSYESDSDIDLDGSSLVAGVSTYRDTTSLAGFIEAGWAESDSHSVSGKHDYYGIGVVLNEQLTDSLYAQIGLRTGWVKTDYNGRFTNDNVSYDSYRWYGGLGLTMGMKKSWGDRLDSDFYAQYTFTYFDRDRLTLNDAQSSSLAWSSSQTQSFELGMRWQMSYSDRLSLSARLAYENVLDGVTDGQLNGLNLKEVDIEGHNGIMQLGVLFKPSKQSPVSLKMSTKGYVGSREGISADMTLQYEF